MAQVLPNSFCWAASFFSACRLRPGPQLEHVPSRHNLQTSQSIPQAPVGIVSPQNSTLSNYGFRFQMSANWQVLHLFNWFD
jgi:hypothetical protein